MHSCTDSKENKWVVYQDDVDKWRWRSIAANGEIVGSSSESYENKADCISNAQTNGMDCMPD